MREIIIKKHAAVCHNDHEICRYMGVKSPVDDIAELLEDCKKECRGVFTPLSCHSIYDIQIDGQTIDFGDFTLESKDLAKCLSGCRRAVVFAVTVGFGIDRLIKKYSVLSPSRALALSAIGTAQTESVCDLFCEEVRAAYGDIRPRFGIGYGDLSLDAQKLIFDNLSVTKHIGITLSDSLLMSPTKSVTAIIGIGKCSAHTERCEDCPKTDCAFRG